MHLLNLFYFIQDSVVSASFSWDSAFFCTCDLSGIVKVWRTSNSENVNTFETGDLSVRFHFCIASHLPLRKPPFTFTFLSISCSGASGIPKAMSCLRVRRMGHCSCGKFRVANAKLSAEVVQNVNAARFFRMVLKISSNFNEKYLAISVICSSCFY